MFTRKDLLFTEVKQNIKSFLSRFGKKTSGVHDSEYWEALTRYKEIVDDISFQDKLLELSLLEAVIIQTCCMQDIKPIVCTNKTAKNPSLYVRENYPRLRGSAHMLTKSMGPRMDFPKNLRTLQENPEFIAEARVKLRQAMEENFIYEAYRVRYPKSLN